MNNNNKKNKVEEKIVENYFWSCLSMTLFFFYIFVNHYSINEFEK
jgi:hypothetical protein